MDFELVTKIACRLQAISNFAYDIHYNARGNDFYENHLFAERLGDQEGTADFKDEIFETVFLGRGQDVPSSKRIESGVLALTPVSAKNEDSDYKMLRGMIATCLEEIESLQDLSMGEGDLFGRIASVLQRHNGLLFARLLYEENEVVANSENQDIAWKYLINAKEDIQWITIKGTHIPIKDGESKDEVIEKFLSDKKKKETPKEKEAKDVERKKKEILQKAEKSEPKITNDIKEITAVVGGKNAGLDFRLKTKESAYRKIKEVLDENIGLEKEDLALGEMWDLNRYTVILPADKLVDGGDKFLSEMKDKGYKVFSVKNTWLDSNNPYKGINVKMVSPNGQKMEVQFHTEKNLNVKEKMHKLYEKYRVETSQTKKDKIKAEMEKIGEQYEKIGGIENFSTSDKYSKKFTDKGVMKKVDSFKGKPQGTYDFKTGKEKTYSRGFSVTFHQNEAGKDGKYKSHFGRYTEDEYDSLTQDISSKYNADVNIGVYGDEPEISFHVETYKDAYKLMKMYNQESIWSWQAGDIIKNTDYDAIKNPMKG